LTADDRWTHYTPDDDPSLTNVHVTRIEVAPDGKVWIGTTGGISIFDGSRFTNIGGGYGRLPTSEVNALLPTDDGGAWVATLNGGLTRVALKASFGFDYTFYTPPLMPNPNIEAMTFGPDGRSLWLGTSRGLVSFFPPQGSAETAAGELGAYPNPFRPSCAADGLHLIGTGGLVRGVVVDLSGRIVARFPAGGGAGALLDPREPIWDGTVEGRLAAPGLYLIRVQTPRGTKTVGVGVLDGDCP
jgi:hypothetical protein